MPFEMKFIPTSEEELQECANLCSNKLNGKTKYAPEAIFSMDLSNVPQKGLGNLTSIREILATNPNLKTDDIKGLSPEQLRKFPVLTTPTTNASTFEERLTKDGESRVQSQIR